MKILQAFLLALFFVAPALAQERSAVPASQAEVSAGTIHNKFVAPDTLPFSAGSIKVLSTGAGNEYTDMRASTNSSAAALGVSFTSAALGYDLWAASGTGRGSNVWGVPFRFPGGILSMGNPFWTDLPNYRYLDQSVYFGMGPAASMRTNAWPNGQTNASVQPGFRIVNGNPFSGIAWLETRTTFTNSSHGTFVGTNYDGVSLYLPGFGLQQGMISDAYGNPNPGTGVIDQIGKYSQEAPSYQIALLNDYTLNAYMCINAHRTGDPSYGGQAPLFAIETDHFLEGDNRVIAGFPVQRGGVWDVRQAADNAPTNWLWALAVDESTSNPTVSTTNSLFEPGKILAESTNQGAYIMGRSWDGTPALFNVQGTADFDLPTQIYGNSGAFTFDAAGTRRFGIVCTQGEYPHIGHASGSPLNISQYSVTDLSTINVGNVPTFTNEITVSADSTVLFPFNILLGSTTAPRVANLPANGGTFWNSNKVVYWVTATKTNMISDGR